MGAGDDEGAHGSKILSGMPGDGRPGSASWWRIRARGWARRRAWGGRVFRRSPAGGEEAATPEPVIRVGHGLGEGGGVFDEVGVVEDARGCDRVVGR